jgi:hypothetical protein
MGLEEWLIRTFRPQAASRYRRVEKCAQEVIDGGDDLATWMKQRPKPFKIAPKSNDQRA